MEIPVVLVDEQDVVLGTMEKLEAHRKGLLHRAFSIMLYRKVNGSIEVLLQQRALTKYHGGGLWANTCCSHPALREDVHQAAYRRLQEEVFCAEKNIEALISLESAGSFVYRAELSEGLVEHEFDHVFVGEYYGDIPDFNQEEIAQMTWVRLDDLLAGQGGGGSLKDENYAPWLLPVCLKTKTYLDFQVSNS